MSDPTPAAVTATLSVRNGAAAIHFYKAAFSATELSRVDDGAGSVVAQLSVDGAVTPSEYECHPEGDGSEV